MLDKINLLPSAGQILPLASRARVKQVTGGERAGKSVYTTAELLTRAPWGKLFWIVAEDYEGCHREFEYAVDGFNKLGALERKGVSMPNRQQWRMNLKSGQLIETKSGQDVSKLRSDAPDGILIVEAGTCSQALFLKSFGRLSETHGWLVISGTFESSYGWYAELFNEMQKPNDTYRGRSFSLPTWTNLTVFPGGREHPEIQRLWRIYRRVPGMFEERVAGIPAKPATLVFREFREYVHVSDQAIYRPGVPVYLAVDPSDGGHPYACLAVQFAMDSDPDPDDPIDFCNVIDEIWETGVIDEQVIDEAMSREWWQDVAGGAIDVNAPDSRRRWATRARRPLVADKIEQLAGIRRLHTFLHYVENDEPGGAQFTTPPHLQVHPQCEGLIHEFNHYKRKDRLINESDLPPEVPSANQPNDAIKALWYLLVARYGYVKSKGVPKPRKYGTTSRARQAAEAELHKVKVSNGQDRIRRRRTVFAAIKQIRR